MGEGKHLSVLLNEALDALAIVPDGTYVDGTFGRGGHARAILKRLGESGRLYALDKDPDALKFAQEVLEADGRFVIVQSSFAELGGRVQQWGLQGKVNGVLLDLGVSSPQLDEAHRGFSFRHDGPLDMRMNPDEGIGAAQWLQKVKEAELADIIKRYGEERYAKRIARAIVKAREERSIQTTKQLADIVAAAHPAWEKGKHPATRTFQAIRIHINRELEDLERGLEQALEALAPGGRLVVISFHSLEDRMVKRFMQKHSQGPQVPPGLAVRESDMHRSLKRIGKMLTPGDEELNTNPRARSSRMRVAEKL
ncbi:MAG: 16S rRNA (cytosine(1402)-N(4))-methyltransferase RsmH [Gammaproteobacteria bacterium]|nr:16S rRNA (cytosine(1402)-N(4))-methyltransferase RsmH [Gammaproteobacteria bacterium]